MTVIFMHGPPAAGKLTVANALSARTGFKVFHNHLSIDCTKPVFEFGGEAFWRINVTIRREVIAEAARTQIDIVHTFCYARGTEDDDFFRELIAAAEDNGGTVYAVVLNCSDDVRRERMVEPSRKEMGKLTNPAMVAGLGERADLISAHPDLESRTMFLDTSDLLPDDAASLIIQRFSLGDIKNSG